MKNIYLHNVRNITEFSDGFELGRLPNNILNIINEKSAIQYAHSEGCEIRFVANDDVIIKLSSDNFANVSVYFGEFYFANYNITNEITTITITKPELLSGNINKLKKHLVFSPNVVRLIIRGGKVKVNSIIGDIRKPLINEMPNKKMLCYGTSITQGASATNAPITYVYQLAHKLKYDCFNLGSSGSAFLDKELAEYFCENIDFDIATLCISVNMLNQGYTSDEFYEKAYEFIDVFRRKYPLKHIFCISVITSFLDFDIKDKSKRNITTAHEFRTVLKKLVENFNSSFIHYIDGKKLIKDPTYLSFDLLHPSDVGMTEIAHNLYKYIKKII